MLKAGIAGSVLYLRAVLRNESAGDYYVLAVSRIARLPAPAKKSHRGPVAERRTCWKNIGQ